MKRSESLPAPWRFWQLAVVALSFLLAGCGGSSKSLEGKVTYAGQPLPLGTITIDPDRSRGNEGVRRSGNIKDGFYRTKPVDGTLEGPVIVRIFGYDGKPLPGKEGVLSPNGTPLCSPYEQRMDLKPGVTTYDFDIPDMKQNPG